MKALLALMLLMTSAAYSFTLKVDDWKKNRDMDRSIVLFTQTIAEKTTLDCQSFIQGLWFGEYEEAYVVLMDPDQCMGLLSRIKTSITRGSSHCIEVGQQEVGKDYRCR